MLGSRCAGGEEMNNCNYKKSELLKANDTQLSFLIGVNLVNTSELILQFPIEMFQNTRKGFGRRKNLENHQLFAAFQSIVNAIELLLKSHIALIDYNLLFKNNKKVSRESIINGDFESINLSKCIEIIENNSNTIFSEKIKNKINSLRIIRNNLTHFYVETTNEMFQKHIAFGLDVYITIYREFIKEKIYDSYDRTEGFEEELSDFEDFVKLRVDEYKEKIKLENYSIPGDPECPVCYTWNLIITENKKMCLFCGYEDKEET